MPKVELAIGSILVTIEHEQSDTRLEYRDLPVVLSCFYSKIHL